MAFPYSRLRDDNRAPIIKVIEPDIEMANQGESRDYYQQQTPPQNYSQQPPKYDQNYGMQENGGYGAQQGYGAPNAAYEGGKPFEQAFKVEKPKLNDVSIGMLLMRKGCVRVGSFHATRIQ